MLDNFSQDPLWSRLSASLGEQMGLHFPKERWVDLKRGIAAAAPAFGMPGAESCARWLLSAPLTQSQIEVLADRLTVGETYFFRDKGSFEALERQILPGLLRARARTERRLRIWSAGCCTGEEPYSIAILLAKMMPDLRDWNVSILATDIDPNFLRKAALGTYGNWSFRDAPQGLRETFFERTKEGRFAISPRIKDMVTFAYLNLAQDGYPSVETGTNAMDIVLCRNVLMYFEEARARTILGKLGRSLLEGGWLLVSPAEIPHVSLPQLVPVHFPGAIVHRKGRHAVDAKPQLLAAPMVLRPEPQSDAPAPPLELPRAEAPPPPSNHDAAAMGLLARNYADQGLLAEASAWCSKALAADKLNPAWCYLHAAILQEQGLAEDAAAALRRALFLAPDYVVAHFALGNLTRRQGKPKDAQRHFRNALAILSGQPADETVPDAGGITAGRLAEAIEGTLSASEERT
jgi:chemotaxis protein methyltransferase CheR